MWQKWLTKLHPAEVGYTSLECCALAACGQLDRDLLVPMTSGPNSNFSYPCTRFG